MSLAAEEENSKWYNGKGIGGTYSIPFRFREPSWLRITLIHADNTSAEIGTNGFTLTGNSALGTAVLRLNDPVAPPTTSKVIISRLAPSTQHLSLAPNSPLPAKDLETALDHLAMAIRDRDSDHKQTASKALLFPVGDLAQRRHHTRHGKRCLSRIDHHLRVRSHGFHDGVGSESLTELLGNGRDEQTHRIIVAPRILP